MGRGKRLRDAQNAQDERGFIFHIWNFGCGTQKKEVEDLLRAKGLPGEVFWPDTEPDDSHKGWCWVHFDLRDEAESTRFQLHRTILRGGSIKRGPITVNLKRARPQAAKSRIQDSLDLPQTPVPAKAKASESFRASSYSIPSAPNLPNPSASSTAIGSSKNHVSLRCPHTWEYDADDPDKYRREFMAAMVVVEANYERMGVKNRPLVIHYPDGHQILRPQLASTAATGETFIYVRNPDSVGEFEKIALQQLPVAELLG
ncbi:hypothetical protein FSARC_6251 [Fusarium sarcochroum]|uniref:RRM domain-containing protein n=1 Tax=Fusarium sarcochroum TaxID=1208366 RepID=A0A8H4TXP0_9HYPO|nr:hypothetical protein FSARC_6251 [Fusarium sarcochroum]